MSPKMTKYFLYDVLLIVSLDFGISNLYIVYVEIVLVIWTCKVR